jgi:hypothetical protein
MRRFAAIVTFCFTALAQQAMTVDQLSKFLHSATHEMKGKQSDQEIAQFLAKVRLTERLDDDTLERIQSDGIGPKTIAVLRGLRDRTANLPPAHAVVAGAQPKLPPPPSSEEQAAILESVRQYALEYSGKLPDFLCHEEMTTYAASRRPDAGWTQISKIDSRLTYFQQKEDYKPLMKDGKLTSTDYEKLKGSKSVGDFGTMLRGVFEPSSQARFEWRTWSTWEGQPAMDFNYRVPQDHSNYQITVEDNRSATPGYSGYFVIDAKTHAIRKLTLVAEDLPHDFPVQTAESTLMYKDQDLSGHTFLLPSDFEAVMSGPEGRDKIEKRFLIYRKYSADSAISFGDDVPDTPPKPIKK